jgi:hypothetical protein
MFPLLNFSGFSAWVATTLVSGATIIVVTATTEVMIAETAETPEVGIGWVIID